MTPLHCSRRRQSTHRAAGPAACGASVRQSSSGEHDNSDQWAARIGLWKWGARSESRNIQTASATASLAPPLLLLHQLNLTRPKTSTFSRPEHTGTPNIQYRRRIPAKWPSLGTEPLAGGEATVSEAPLQSRSLIEYFHDFDDISLFRLLESTSALLKSTRNCSTHYSHKHSTVVHGWDAVVDVSRLEGLPESTSPYPPLFALLSTLQNHNPHPATKRLREICQGFITSTQTNESALPSCLHHLSEPREHKQTKRSST